MTSPFVDTSIIIRFLTGDDPTKQKAVADLLKQAENGQITLFVPAIVISEVVFVLESPRTYNLARATIASGILALLNIKNIRVENRQTVLRALSIYGAFPRLSYADAAIAAAMLESSTDTIFSYDRGFDLLVEITRNEP